MKFCSDVHGPQRMKPNGINDLMTFSPSAIDKSNVSLTQCSISMCLVVLTKFAMTFMIARFANRLTKLSLTSAGFIAN